MTGSTPPHFSADMPEQARMDNPQLFETAQRERAELAEQRYRDLVASIDAVIWEADLPGRRFTFVSQQIEQLTGYPAEQWLNDPGLWLRVVHPADRERASAAWHGATADRAADRATYSCEYRVITRDGQVRSLRDYGVAQVLDGRPRRIHGIITDVTAAWQAALAQERRVHQVALLADIGVALTEGGALESTLDRCVAAIVDHLHVAFARIWILDAAENMLKLGASAGMYTHLDGSHSHVPVGKFKIGTIAQDRQPHLTNDVANDPQVSDHQWAREQGMVAFAGYPLLVEDRLVGVLGMFAKEALASDTLGALAAVADSIAQGIERKRVESERVGLLAREQTARLEAEALQKRFALLAEMSAELASSLDYGITLRKVAQLSVPQLADWCAVDMLGEDGEISRLAVIHSDPAKIQLAYDLQQRYAPDPNAARGLHQVLRSGQPELMYAIPDSLLVAGARDEEHLRIVRELGFTSYLIVPLRSRNHTLGALTLVFAESGRHYDQEALALAEELARRAATAVDNARLYRAAQQLNDELEQRVRERTAALEAAMNELDSFSYSVSHDLRTPLRSLDGFSLALLEDYGDQLDSEGQDYLRRIRAASQRMDRLINDLLQLSRVSRREIAREPVDLSAIARAVVAELHRQYPDRQVRAEIGENLVANGDKSLIQLALENLLHNSWKFTSNQPDAQIWFGQATERGHTAFFVRDNGAGFDMAYADKLFSAFQRLHTEKEFPGTGIGLATVFRIIQRHGGQIWAESAIGQGASFYFTL